MKATTKISILLIITFLLLSLTNCSVPSSTKEEQEEQKKEKNQSDQTAGEKNSQPLQRPNPIDPFHEGTSSLNDPGSDYFVFVDIQNGNDGATGSRYAPVDDINEGIGIAFQQNKDVCVAKGVYEVGVDAESHIEMKSGVAVYGGYSNDMLWIRDINKNETIIQNILAGNQDRYTIHFGSETNEDTRLDGFIIIGGNKYSYNIIYCYTAKGVISHNKIYGIDTKNHSNLSLSCKISEMTIYDNDISGGRGDRSTGVVFQRSKLACYNNRISGGYGFEKAYAVRIRDNCSGFFKENDITGGESPKETCALYIYESDIAIHENKINGGSSKITYGIYTEFAGYEYSRLSYHSPIYNNSINGGNASDKSYGICCRLNTNSEIWDNDINSGSGEESFCIFVYRYAHPYIAGNFLKCWYTNTKTTRWGIYEGDNRSEPSFLLENIFNISLNLGSPGGFYRKCIDQNSGIVITKIDDLNALDENGYNPANTVFDNKYNNKLPLQPVL